MTLLLHSFQKKTSIRDLKPLMKEPPTGLQYLILLKRKPPTQTIPRTAAAIWKEMGEMLRFHKQKKNNCSLGARRKRREKSQERSRVEHEEREEKKKVDGKSNNRQGIGCWD